MISQLSSVLLHCHQCGVIAAAASSSQEAADAGFATIIAHHKCSSSRERNKKKMTAVTSDTDFDNSASSSSSSSSSYRHSIRPRYREGQRFCTSCRVWWKPQEYLHTAPYCPSRFCKRLLRTKPRSRRQRALTNEGRITRY